MANAETKTAGRSRAARGSLTRAQIVASALRLLEARGPAGLSIRQLAAELGVSPMAVYRHVRNKDDLLDEVVDRLLSTTWEPRSERLHWEAWILDAADRLRAFLVSQPLALEAYLRHPVTSPAAVARMEAMLRALRHGLVTEQAARRAYAAIHTYTIGFAALQAARLAAPDQSAKGLARELSSYTTRAQFREGLRCLVVGLRSAT